MRLQPRAAGFLERLIEAARGQLHDARRRCARVERETVAAEQIGAQGRRAPVERDESGRGRGYAHRLILRDGYGARQPSSSEIARTSRCTTGISSSMRSCGHIGNGAFHRQGRDDRTRRIAHGCGDAADRRLVLFEIEGEAAVRVACHALQKGVDVGAVVGPEAHLRERARRFKQLSPCVRFEIEHQRLADVRRGKRHAMAHARAHFQPARAGNLVDAEDVVAVAHA